MDESTSSHPEIVERLPDYAIGALDDAMLDYVTEHLDGCAPCRHELRQVLEVGGSIAATPPPGQEVRRAVLARALDPALPIGVGQPPSAPPAPPRPLVVPEATRRPISPPQARAWLGSGWPVWLGLAAAGLVLLLGLGIWNLRLPREIDERNTQAVLDADTRTFPLTDSQLVPPAYGVLLADPAQTRGLLRVEKLPALPPGQRYQIWLYTDDGERTRAGTFAPGPDGRADVPLDVPAPFATFGAIAVSAEPSTGTASPTAPLALGGWLVD